MPRPLVTTAIVLVALASAAATSPDPTAEPRQLAGDNFASPLLLAEVLFDPAPGDTPFVEILNAGSAPADLTRMAIGIGDMQLPLARAGAPLAPGARLLVRFDGAGRAEPGVVHLPPSVTVNAESGAIALIDEHGETIDRVAWGDEYGAVDPALESAARGRTIGRPPGAVGRFDRTEWLVFGPADATPGAPNPLPAVDVLLPSDDEIVTGPSVVLDWYGVTGASNYRVQLARDDTFATPVLDVRSATSRAQAGALPPGRYVWRVQAEGSGGSTARFSTAASFVVAPATASGVRPAPSLALSVRPTASGQNPTLAPNVLPVPLIEQHKDTEMLQLENRRKDHPHGWDRDHGSYDPNDPADSNNCVLASVVMINRWLRGNLSQDRVAYEVRSREGQKYAPLITSAPDMAGFASLTDAAGIARRLREEGPPGAPEWDLIYGLQDGLTPIQIVAAITYALAPASPSARDGGVARRVQIPDVETAWKELKREIDAGRPVVVSRVNPSGTSGHAYVVHGYDFNPDGTRFFRVNDPIRGARRPPLATMPIDRMDWYFLPENPRATRQEAEVTRDSDFDGVVDFDETERFFTDPNNRDSDGDGVWDKEDIASGVFDGTYGYAAHTASTKGRDFDGDDTPTERDRDSDDGGCRDGLEDANGNGDRTSPESWNFDDTDDLCGEISGTIVWRTHTRNTAGPQITESRATMVVTVKLREEQPGESGPLVDNGSRFRISGAGTFTLAWEGSCQPFARDAGSGSGSFVPPDSDIGGYLSEEGLVVGANASIQGTATTDLCVMAGSGPAEITMALPDCLGERVGTSRSYRFSCTTPPPLSPGLAGIEFLEWSMTGIVTLAPPPTP